MGGDEDKSFACAITCDACRTRQMVAVNATNLKLIDRAAVENLVPYLTESITLPANDSSLLDMVPLETTVAPRISFVIVTSL